MSTRIPRVLSKFGSLLARVLTPRRATSQRAVSRRTLIAAMLIVAFGAGTTLAEAAPARTKFKIAWTIYAGWMPWDYAEASGVVQKWARKYGIEIDVVQVNDYVESLNLYTAGQFDGVTATNMDTLTIPSASGVDTTALVIGDFSNGNDGIVLKNGRSVKDLKGRKVNLVELSVSHYLLARALGMNGMSERDITVVNTSDADMVGVYATPAVTAAVTWNPLLAEIARTPRSSLVFNSSQIPGEIIDLLVVNTNTLRANPALGKALTGAWYEIMTRMSTPGAARTAAITHMARASGTNVAGFEAQLRSTRMFYKPADAVTFARSPALGNTMRAVANFCFSHGLLGQGARSADAVGVQLGNGTVLGNRNNVKLRFNTEYMAMAAAGKL